MELGKNLSISLLLHTVGLFLVPVIFVLAFASASIELLLRISPLIGIALLGAITVSFLPSDKKARYPRWLCIFNLILTIPLALFTFSVLSPLLLIGAAFNTNASMYKLLLPVTWFFVGLSFYLSIMHFKRAARQKKTDTVT